MCASCPWICCPRSTTKAKNFFDVQNLLGKKNPNRVIVSINNLNNIEKTQQKKLTNKKITTKKNIKNQI
jgi:nicotinic acid mononucleotide adenylyltransferase